MNTDSKSPGESGGGGQHGRPNLTLDQGETVTLSPTSSRFGHIYKQYRPRAIGELKELIGVDVAAHAVASPGPLCCRAPELTSTLMTPDHLKADDPAIRAKANRLSYLAAREYLTGNTAQVSQWVKTIDAWLVTQEPIIFVASLWDIDIAAGATLNLSANTHALYANKITIHGNGRINCNASVTIKALSLEGVNYGSLVSKVSGVAKAVLHP